MIDNFSRYLNDGDLVEEVVAANGKDTYVMPARRNAGHVAIALIREIVAPTVFRNAEEEITDAEDRDGVRRVRATPSKFKFGERGRGLLVLRAWNVGGRLPQNRSAVGDRMPVRDAFDLNTLVFGDSAMWGTRVLPVKAAVQYSDALSTVPYRDAVGDSFHHRGDETGTLWDAEKKEEHREPVHPPLRSARHAADSSVDQQWAAASAAGARSPAAEPRPRRLVRRPDLGHRGQRAHAYRRDLCGAPRDAAVLSVRAAARAAERPRLRLDVGTGNRSPDREHSYSGLRHRPCRRDRRDHGGALSGPRRHRRGDSLPTATRDGVRTGRSRPEKPLRGMRRAGCRSVRAVLQPKEGRDRWRRASFPFDSLLFPLGRGMDSPCRGGPRRSTTL